LIAYNPDNVRTHEHTSIDVRSQVTAQIP